MPIEKLLVGLSFLCLVGTSAAVYASDSKSLTLTQIGRYSAGVSTNPDEPRAEISAFDPSSKRLFSINLNLRQLDILDLSPLKRLCWSRQCPSGASRTALL